MKTGVHPQYHTDAVVNCANCKTKFKTGGTIKEVKIEICSACHPFFTGKKILIDTEGRVDRFRQKAGAATGRVKKVRKKKTLEERVNTEIAAQLEKDAEVEAVEKAKKVAKKAAREEAKVAEEGVVEEVKAETTKKEAKVETEVAPKEAMEELAEAPIVEETAKTEEAAPEKEEAAE
jgi:large subunit ribosomal protein L31